MTADLATLQARLEQRTGAKSKKARPPWQPPVMPDDFLPGRFVLAFDASLANIGWVLLWGNPVVVVMHKGTIRPKTELTGYRETWEKAIQLSDQLAGMSSVFMTADYIAVEAPSVGGGHRTESSLVAGLQVWQAAPAGILRDIGATHVSAVLCGNAKLGQDVRKAAVKRAVARYLPDSEGRTWNEHERDAAAIGLTLLWDLRHA